MVHKKLLGGLVFIGLAACAVLYSLSWSTTLVSSSAGLSLDLTAPDAIIRSKHLSSLPADLLKVPLLHDLLSEDFLFYYENSESRLGLRGTLRRIAYEHEVNFSDELIKLVMDEPAEVAFWRGGKGELKYYTVAMTRNKLAKLLEPLAKIAMKDRQLTLAGEVKVAGDTVQIFALEYAANRRLLLASLNDRVVLFSDPGMLLNTEGGVLATTDSLLNDLLGSDVQKQQRFAQAFDLKESSNDHSIAVKTSFLSFHYQHFFPALKALRFEFGEKSLLSSQNWSTALLLDVPPEKAGQLMNGQKLWSAMPYQAGTCVALPVDWSAVVATMNAPEVASMPAEQLQTLFGGMAGVCWYATSRLHTPLFVAQINKTEGTDALLEKYFNYGIKLGDDEDAQLKGQVKAKTTPAGDVIWQSPKNPGNNTQPALARSQNFIYFSPDAALVDQALAVAHKRQPAASDSWKDASVAANTLALIGPNQLSQLAEREVALSLPRQQDELLRNAADQHLLPKLAAVKKYPAMRLEMKDTPKGAGWVELEWQTY